MNQLEKLIYVIPSCQEVRLEPGESISQTSLLKEIFLTETGGQRAVIDIEHLDYEGL